MMQLSHFDNVTALFGLCKLFIWQDCHSYACTDSLLYQASAA